MWENKNKVALYTLVNSRSIIKNLEFTAVYKVTLYSRLTNSYYLPLFYCIEDLITWFMMLGYSKSTCVCVCVCVCVCATNTCHKYVPQVCATKYTDTSGGIFILFFSSYEKDRIVIIYMHVYIILLKKKFIREKAIVYIHAFLFIFLYIYKKKLLDYF